MVVSFPPPPSLPPSTSLPPSASDAVDKGEGEEESREDGREKWKTDLKEGKKGVKKEVYISRDDMGILVGWRREYWERDEPPPGRKRA